MKPEKNFFVKFGLAVFISLSAVVAFYFFLLRYQEVKAFFKIITSSLQPVMAGIVLAYLLCPVTKFLERLCCKTKLRASMARLISVLLSIVFAFGILSFFCALVLPQLVESVKGLIVDLPRLLEVQLERLNNYLTADNEAAYTVMQMISSVETSLMTWIKTNLFATVSTVAGSVISIGSALVNLVVSVIVTIYLLLDRERYLAQVRKLFFAASKNQRFNRIVMETAHQVNQIFGGFISGKLLDSLIVGIICFVCLKVMNMPYALLVSVIVGVTNIIPMFGPFIGAVPSAFLILLVSPAKCVAFLVFIVILQQVDGNIIGPRILGNSTGLSALYVTVAMLLFGKLMGFMGMIVGVPLFATLYYIIKRIAEYSLRQQNMPVETAEYDYKKEENKNIGGENEQGQIQPKV